ALRRRRNQVSGVILLRQLQRLESSCRPHPQRGNAVRHVIRGTSWTSEVKHVFNRTNIERITDIELAKFKSRVVFHMFDVLKTTGDQIVDCDNGVSVAEQSVTKMRPQESRSSGY